MSALLRRAGVLPLVEGGGATMRRHQRRARISSVPLISFAQQLANLAAADPGHAAITDEDETVDRAELERRANRTARALAKKGVVQDDLVTIALPNSVAFVATVIAALKLGATPQPVSARLPKRELEAIIELAAPRVVVEAPLVIDGFDDGPVP